jgi:hypothetical protein
MGISQRLLALLCTAAPLLAATVPAATAEPGWRPARAPLTTPWTSQVSPANALPDYPRPQLTRPQWRNLNGLWEYGGGERVLVPYPPESALSGIRRHDDVMVYQRGFDVPKSWRGKRLLLHFGAVDQDATVLVNGRQVAEHSGGYGAFSADVTGALKPGRQELKVRAVDRNDAAEHPVGKQRNKPGGILYTGSSGIWQTVWMEPVANSYVDSVDIASDVPRRSFVVTPNITRTGPRPTGRTVAVVVRSKNGAVVGRATGKAGQRLRIAVRGARLWSPQHPYLYDFTVRLRDGRRRTVDEVGSYAGMRAISLVKDAKGRARIALNGRILFQEGLLDQGYWPDGLYTAPTDAALRFDLEQTKALGFNMVRKHVKVEPARWYYWADRLGLLVWQDMPSLPIDLTVDPGSNPSPDTVARQNFRKQLAEMVGQHRSITSIIGWVTFNEGWGEFDTSSIAQETRTADPTRLVNASSGVNCCFALPDSGAGDIYDNHSYVGPGTSVAAGGRAAINGEYGGLGLELPGHMWPGRPQAYEMTRSGAQLTARFGRLADAMVRAVRAGGISAGVYTQTTDVENEVNGLFSYDRRVLKVDPAVVRRHNLAIIGAGSS